jgi:prepilin-type N-terminal cleavage/methylation domain-containing protein
MQQSQKAGFSLIESLICLFIFCLVFLAGLSSVRTLQEHYTDLTLEFESNETALFALDKIKTDLETAGQGLFLPISLGLLDGLTVIDNNLSIICKDAELPVRDHLYSGQTRIATESTSTLKKNRSICVHDHTHGEIRTISSIENNSIILSSPLEYSYKRDETHILVLRSVEIFPDSNAPVLRRKVNTSSAQPLVEDIEAFAISYHSESHLAEIQLNLKSNLERKYACTLSLKNLALVSDL